MAQLEPLNLRITGDARGLSAALGKARTDVSDLTNRLQQSSLRVGKFSPSGMIAGFQSLGPAGAAAGAAVMATLATITAGATAAAVAIGGIKSSFDKIDAVTDSAKKLGLSFQELSSVRFAVGESSGLDTESIDRSLQRLLIGLGEAKRGSGEAMDALKMLGLQPGPLLDAGPLEALKRIADRTQKLSSSTDQLLVAYGLFGRQGTAIVNTFREGADALQESSDFAAKWLNLTVAQTEAVGKANDLWGRIGTIMESIAQLAAAELAPAFIAVSEAVLGTADGLNGMQESIRGIVDLSARMAGNATDFGEALLAPTALMKNFAVGDFAGLLNTLNGAFDFSSGDKAVAKLQEIRTKFEELAEDSKNLVSTDLIDLENIENSKSALDGLSQTQEKWASSAERIRKTLATPLEKYQASIQELSEAVKNGGLEWEYFNRGVAKATEELDQANNRIVKPVFAKAVLKGSAEEQFAEFERKLQASQPKLTDVSFRVKGEADKLLSADGSKAAASIDGLASSLDRLNKSESLKLPTELEAVSRSASSAIALVDELGKKLDEINGIDSQASNLSKLSTNLQREPVAKSANSSSVTERIATVSQAKPSIDVEKERREAEKSNRSTMERTNVLLAELVRIARSKQVPTPVQM